MQVGFRCASGLLAIQVAAAGVTTPATAASGPGAPGPLRVGQEWHYKTRKGEERSTLVIVRLDRVPGGKKIAHVSVKGVRLENAREPGGFSTVVPHLAFDEPVLRRSLTTLVADSVPLPPFEPSYQEWRAAWDRHQAAVLDVPVTEALALVEATLSYGR